MTEQKGKSGFTRRRFRIRIKDWETFGHTASCPARGAAKRGTTATNHLEDCRKRIAEECDKVGDERLARGTEMLLEYLAEEKSKTNKSKASESSGDTKAGASPGVPIAAESGDSVPEVAKRKIGDSEPGESEHPEDQKPERKKVRERSQENHGRVGGVRQKDKDQGRRKSRGELEPRRRCGYQPSSRC